ncbi:MAG: formate dehydrogenase accessory sulfurtransferase FdhD [Chloroherpetonaceae bacterium]
MTRSIQSFEIYKVRDGAIAKSRDVLAVEEPLEIQVASFENGFSTVKSLSVTMRTPSHDTELAVGFLFTEGIITSLSDIHDVHYHFPSAQKTQHQNIIRVVLKPTVELDFKKLERHFYMSSSCGVCGKASINAVRLADSCSARWKEPFAVSTDLINSLPETLRQSQEIFDQTGGLHAAALFDLNGHLLCVREDVGRHNALDKLIGAELLSGRDFERTILLVSGRASFELVQKAVMAGIPMLCAVGAPSSLAVELADEFDLTLIGFLRPNRFNLYTSDWRVKKPTLSERITFRTFEPKDAQGVYETALHSFRETYKNVFRDEMIEQMVRKDYEPDSLVKLIDKIESGDMCFYVALDGERVIGFCNFGFCDKGLELRRIYLHPDYIGKGVGKRLLELGENFALATGSEKYFCFVHKQNEIGKRFYFKNGFLHNDSEDSGDQWFMMKELKSKHR